MKYVYETLRLTCGDAKHFAVDQILEAVEYLRSCESTPDAGLIARTLTTVCKYRLRGEPKLSLDQMLGKTRAEIWAAFDAEVDRWSAGLEARHMGNDHCPT